MSPILFELGGRGEGMLSLALFDFSFLFIFLLSVSSESAKAAKALSLTCLLGNSIFLSFKLNNLSPKSIFFAVIPITIANKAVTIKIIPNK